MFTRQHFQAVADTIQPTMRGSYLMDARRESVETIVTELAITFQRDNPGFKPERFFMACGVKSGYVNQMLAEHKRIMHLHS